MCFRTKMRERERVRKNESASSSMAAELKENTLINTREFLGSCSEKL